MDNVKPDTNVYKLGQKLKRADLALMRFIRKTECPTLTFLMRFITEIGSPVGWTVISLGIMFTDNFTGGIGLQIGLVSLCAAFIAKGIKHAFRRTRPCTHQNFPKALAPVPDRWSFPSGHTTSAFAVGFFLLGAPHATAPFFLTLAVSVACSRVYLGVHFPSDVFGGACLGSIVGLSLFPFMNLWFA